jgi:hypothetical protein
MVEVRSKIKLQPVEKADPPAYPTLDELPAEKALEGNLPQRWQKARGLAGALALFLAANATGCGTAADNAGGSQGGADEQINCPTAAEFIEARQWVKGIYEDHPRPLILGEIAVPLPVKEDEATSIIKEHQHHQ